MFQSRLRVPFSNGGSGNLGFEAIGAITEIVEQVIFYYGAKCENQFLMRWN